jgi:hypothetical protein
MCNQATRKNCRSTLVAADVAPNLRRYLPVSRSGLRGVTRQRVRLNPDRWVEQWQSERIMQLNAERLILREVEWSDLDDIHSLHSLPEVDEFNTLGIPADKKETERFLASLIDDKQTQPRKRYSWVIVERPSDKFVGVVGLNLSACIMGQGICNRGSESRDSIWL